MKTLEELKQELKEWKSQDVKERFESVNSNFHLLTIENIKQKIKNIK